jgi:peptidyl-prolyl cis-trans isomerase A (cyclophilin A)
MNDSTYTLRYGLRPLSIAALVLAVSCKSKPPEPEPMKQPEPPPAATPNASAAANETMPAASANADATPQASAATPAPSGSVAAAAASDTGKNGTVVVANGGPDPLDGKWTLAQATAGLAGKGKLVAEIKTEKGKLECELYEDKAPITVANFVGLARGLRPFKDANGAWIKKPGYDGTGFHRVIRGFMIQGGDPAGTGAGEPGYTFMDEIWEGAKHDQRGLLCMANRGKDTNGMQFFITDAAAAHLDGGYTIFGKCQPDTVIEALANVPVRGDSAVEPPKIESIVVRRDGAKKKTGAAAKSK